MIDARSLYSLRPLAVVEDSGSGTWWVRSLGGAFVARLELLDDDRICITASYGDGKWPLEGLDRDPYADSLPEAIARLELARAAILSNDLEPITGPNSGS